MEKLSTNKMETSKITGDIKFRPQKEQLQVSKTALKWLEKPWKKNWLSPNNRKRYIPLRGQTVHFAYCKRIRQQGRSICSSFCSFIFFYSFDKILTRLRTCLWNPGINRHIIVRLSSAQFGLVMTSNEKLSTACTGVPWIIIDYFVIL